MEWELTKEQSRASLGRIFHHTATPVGHDRNVVGLLSGLLKEEYLIGETPHQSVMFINQFMAVKVNFLKGDFQALGWVHSSDKNWWSRMVGFVLKDLREELIKTNLYAAVRAIQCGIPQSNITSSLCWSAITRDGHILHPSRRDGVGYTQDV